MYAHTITTASYIQFVTGGGEGGMTTSREKRWSLAGATALVTGGSKGIGYLIHVFLEFSSVLLTRWPSCSTHV
jgi:hypothetical protein